MADSGFEAVAAQFAALSVDRVSSRYTEDVLHKAPYKPLLLLSVLQLIDEGKVTSREISPVLRPLAEAFLHYGAIVPQGRKHQMALPFYHMGSEDFWELIDHQGEVRQAKGAQLRSMGLLREEVAHARLTEDAWVVLSDSDGRAALREHLIVTHFSETAGERLREQREVNMDANEYADRLLEMRADAERMRETREPVRNQGFRKAVQTAYDHRCAFTGLRLLTPEYHTAIDAAHIVPWKESHDDRVQNGLALSKLCHWAFDEGLLGVTESSLIRVSPFVARGGHRVGQLLDLDGREIHRPESEEHHPDPESFDWHLKNTFTRW
jgi:putative restriction endonuclease